MKYQQPPRQVKASPKPLLVGLIAVFVLMGAFILKSYQMRKYDAATGADPKNQTEGSLDVPLIQPKEVAKLILNDDYQLIDIREKRDSR